MPEQIIRQPDGRYCVWSSITESITVYDATEEEILDYYAERAAADARRQVTRIIGYVAVGDPRSAYFQFAMTYEEALAAHRERYGELKEAGSG